MGACRSAAANSRFAYWAGHTALQLGQTRIYLPGGRVARLSDIAEVRDGVGEIRSVSRLNGRTATTFGVFRSKGSSDVTVMDLVTREIDKIGKEFPQVKLKAEHGWFELDPAFYYGGIHGRRSDGQEINLPGGDQFAVEMDDFARCIQERKPSRVSGEEGLRDVKIMLAIYESIRTNAAVKLA